MKVLATKIICGFLITAMTASFGYLPSFCSGQISDTKPGDPHYNKKSTRNTVLGFLLSAGGGVLITNCFCHWLPEVRESKFNCPNNQIITIYPDLISIGITESYESELPVTEIIMCAGFFAVCLLEEIIHHFIHPHKKSKNMTTKSPTKSPPEPNNLIKMQSINEFDRYDLKAREAKKRNSNSTIKDDLSKSASSIEDISGSSGLESATSADDRAQSQHTKSVLRTFFVVVAISFHSVLSGLAIALEDNSDGVWLNFAAIAMHKFVIAFAVGVELVSTQVQYPLNTFIFRINLKLILGDARSIFCIDCCIRISSIIRSGHRDNFRHCKKRRCFLQRISSSNHAR